jgi:molybdopterin converting factor small subunit
VAVTVRVPAQLRGLTSGAREVSVASGTLREVIGSLNAAHPGVEARLFDDSGSIRRFVNVFVADEDVRHLDGLETEVADGQTVSIMPAVAGG